MTRKFYNKEGKYKEITKSVAEYYEKKLELYGATAQGVDWKDEKSQITRFEKLTYALPKSNFSIIDYGCGYGKLYEFLRSKYENFRYIGYDISPKMIETAKLIYPDANFTSERKDLVISDWCVASGIFNVKLNFSKKIWEEYIMQTLEDMNSLSTHGFAFNMLSLYSDREKRKKYLYYADPLFYFDMCKRKFSRFVALLHDYPLWEFTIVVIKKA